MYKKRLDRARQNLVASVTVAYFRDIVVKVRPAELPDGSVFGRGNEENKGNKKQK